MNYLTPQMVIELLTHEGDAKSRQAIRRLAHSSRSRSGTIEESSDVPDVGIEAVLARAQRMVDIAEKIAWVDYKDVNLLRRFMSERGKIRSRRITGLSRRQQSQVAKAVKRARSMGLLISPDPDRKGRH